MTDTHLHYMWLAAIPLISVLCLGINFFIRARGGRSVKLNLKAFGIELKLESYATGNGSSSDAEETRAVAP